MPGRPAPHGSGWRVKWRLPSGRDQSKTMVTEPDAWHLYHLVEDSSDTVLSDDLPVRRGKFIDLDRESTGTPTAEGVGESFEEYGLSRWLPRQQVADYSALAYGQQIRRVKGSFLAKDIGLVTADDLPVVQKDLSDRYKPNTVNATMTTVRSIIRMAVIEKLLSTDPLLTVKPPRRAVSEDIDVADEDGDDEEGDILPLETDEYERLRSHTLSAMCALVMDVLAYGGIRVGEALALRVNTVEFTDDGATLIVRRSLKRSGKLGPTKGRRRRAVDVDRDLADALRVWISANRLSGRDFIFPSRQADRSKPVSYMWFWREFDLCRRAADAAGHLPKDAPRLVRIHDLRHSHASWLMALGVSLLKIARRLGHRNTTITEETYGHLSREGRGSVRNVLPMLRSRPRASLYAVATNDGGVHPIGPESEFEAAGY